MLEVESGDVAAMREEAFGKILDEINAKQRQWRKSSILGGTALLFGSIAAIAMGQVGATLMLLALPAWAFGRWIDSYQRTAVLLYSLDQSINTAYQALASSFDEMASCAGKWHVEAGGAVRDLTTWKRNAGASHIVRKKPTFLTYKLPSVIKSNITPPAINVGRKTMYFFPDVVLFEDKGRIGAVAYGNLRMRWQESNFIEGGSVPRDAQVIGHVWAHPNKNGGPDRRFKNNRQIPLCRYEALHISSISGVNELIELSRTGFVERFAHLSQSLPKQNVGQIPALEHVLQSNEVTDFSLPSENTDACQDQPESIAAHRRVSFKQVVLICAVGFVVFVAAHLYGLRPVEHSSVDTSSGPDTANQPSSSAVQDVRLPPEKPKLTNAYETNHSATEVESLGKPRAKVGLLQQAGKASESITMVPQSAIAPVVDAHKQLQQRLSALGYFHGPINGVWGPRSRTALKEFRWAQGLGNDDQLNDETRTALFSEGATRSPFGR